VNGPRKGSRVAFNSILPTALIVALGVLAASPAWSQAPSDKKKELVARVLQLQVPEIASALVEQPAMTMLQQAGQVIRERVPADQREAVAKRIQESTNKFVDETTPLLRERAQKLAPSTLGVAIEQKFTEDELKQLLTWLESPVSRKYQQVTPEIQSAFVQKLVAESRPVVDPKLKQLDDAIRGALGLPPAAAARPPAPPASKPATK
jgi:uncharacterized protein